MYNTLITYAIPFLMLLTVGILSRLQAGPSGVRITAGVRETSLMQKVQTTSGVHPVSYSISTGLFLGRKVTGS